MKNLTEQNGNNGITKQQHNQFKNTAKGITLIALVITKVTKMKNVIKLLKEYFHELILTKLMILLMKYRAYQL